MRSKRADLGMQVGALHADFGVVFGKIFGHALGQGGDQNALVQLHAPADFMQQVVHLAFDGTHVDLRIDQASGPDDLLDNHAGRLGELIGPGRGGDIEHLVHAILELFKSERTIVHRAGQAEAIIHQHLFARAVAMIHALQLRDGLVAFVQEQQMIVGEIIEQCRRRFARQASGKMARIIFDAVAIADLADHLQIEHGALVQALRFHQLAALFEFLLPPFQLRLDAAQRAFARFGRHYVMRFGIDRQAQIGLADLAEHRVDLAEAVHFVAPQLDAISVIVVGGEDFDDVAAHAKCSAREAVIVALVEDFDQAREDLLARDLLAFFEHQQHAVIGFGRAEAVDATDAGDDDAIAALE